MEPQITVNDFKDSIVATANDRYILSVDNETTIRLTSLAPESILEKNVVQLKRKNNDTNNWRTILISIIETTEGFVNVLKWIADVRDELLDPEASDLYSITAIIESELSMDICTNIESDDKFCRKYLLRPNESIEGLLSRTFLITLSNETSDEDIVDPLLTALNSTGKNMTWFTSDIQNYWQTVLLSGKTSADLIENLFNDNLTSTENDEASAENNDQ